MKTIAFILAIAMLAFRLPAPIVLTISPLQDGDMQIIGSVPNLPGRAYFVLESTTNFSDWTPIVTNSSTGGSFTNIVPVTNLATFYRLATTNHVVN